MLPVVWLLLGPGRRRRKIAPLIQNASPLRLNRGSPVEHFPDQVPPGLGHRFGSCRIARQILDIETQAPAVRKKLVVSIHQDAPRRAGMVERTGPLSEWETRRAVADHKFSAKKALMPVAAFRIEEMVGNGKTFFGSSRGGKPEGRLGKDPKQPGKKGRTTGSK